MTDDPWPKRPVGFYQQAIGQPVTHPAVQAVVEQLGTVYDVEDYIDRTRHDYDPDIARSLRWEFTRVPKANSYPSHLRVLDGVVVAVVLSPELVVGGQGSTVTLTLPAEPEETVLCFEASDGSWPPEVVRRGTQYLFRLWVPQGHWDGKYQFPLTSEQVESLSSRPVWQELWTTLHAICQSQNTLSDPATLPGHAQHAIDRICGRAH